MDKATNELIQGSMDKAKQKLEASRLLLNKEAFDDAVSRAYYAAFHAAHAMLMSEGLTADTHRGLLNLFGLHFVRAKKVSKEMGRYLSNLKDDREVGDYEAFSSLDSEATARAVKEAELFVSEAETYLKKILG